MSPLEIAAAILGVVTVFLVVRRSVWNYPFALAMVALYFVVFFEARLYSDALLQIFFFAINLYGWWAWHHAPQVDSGVKVVAMRGSARLAWLAATLAASAAWGFLMARFTDAAAPFADAAIAGTSVSAQILQSLRRIETWLLWIAVDVGAIGLFWSRDLVVTAGLYGLFLIMSVAGFVEWKKRLA